MLIFYLGYITGKYTFFRKKKNIFLQMSMFAFSFVNIFIEGTRKPVLADCSTLHKTSTHIYVIRIR